MEGMIKLMINDGKKGIDEQLSKWIEGLVTKLKDMGIFEKVEKKELFSKEYLSETKIEDGDEVYKDLVKTAGTRYTVYTRTMVYDIHGYDDKSYLGCIAVARDPLMGMSDLPDGEFDEDTWGLIEQEIIDSEIEEDKTMELNK